MFMIFRCRFQIQDRTYTYEKLSFIIDIHFGTLSVTVLLNSRLEQSGSIMLWTWCLEVFFWYPVEISFGVLRVNYAVTTLHQ